jgi:hypothetical protein
MKTLFGYVLIEEGFVRQLRYIDTTSVTIYIVNLGRLDLIDNFQCHFQLF